MKKFLTAGLVGLTLLGVGVSTVSVISADTVYYRGTKVSFRTGRYAGVYFWSSVQTSLWTHSTTLNGSFSGRKAPGIEASVNKYVGGGGVEAYWNCY